MLHHVEVHADKRADRLKIAEHHVHAKFPGATVISSRYSGEHCPHGDPVVEVLYYPPNTSRPAAGFQTSNL